MAAMVPPPYAVGKKVISYDRHLGDERSVMASKERILAFEKAQKNATTITGPCPLLELPAELRTCIWQYVLQGGKYNPPTIETTAR
jgi:hypothetical protein